ncbi:MAG: hypothetical protein ACOY94_20590 [Bacillota bacterium]
MASTAARLYLSQGILNATVTAMYHANPAFRGFSAPGAQVQLNSPPALSIDAGAAEGRLLRIDMEKVAVQSPLAEFTVPVVARGRVTIQNSRLSVSDLRAQVHGSHPWIDQKVSDLLNSAVIPSVQTQLQQQLNQIPLDLPHPSFENFPYPLRPPAVPNMGLGNIAAMAAGSEGALAVDCNGLPAGPAVDPGEGELQELLGGQNRVVARVAWSTVDALLRGFVDVNLRQVHDPDRPFVVETPVSGVKLWLRFVAGSYVNSGTPYLRLTTIPRLEIWFPIIGYKEFPVPTTEASVPFALLHRENAIYAKLKAPRVQDIFSLDPLLRALPSEVSFILKSVVDGLMHPINTALSGVITPALDRIEIPIWTLPTRPIPALPATAKISSLGFAGSDLQAVVDVAAS